MVRRRSTVRFRKGAPGYENFSNIELSTSLGVSGLESAAEAIKRSPVTRRFARHTRVERLPLGEKVLLHRLKLRVPGGKLRCHNLNVRLRFGGPGDAATTPPQMAGHAAHRARCNHDQDVQSVIKRARRNFPAMAGSRTSYIKDETE